MQCDFNGMAWLGGVCEEFLYAGFSSIKTNLIKEVYKVLFNKRDIGFDRYSKGEIEAICDVNPHLSASSIGMSIILSRPRQLG